MNIPKSSRLCLRLEIFSWNVGRLMVCEEKRRFHFTRPWPIPGNASFTWRKPTRSVHEEPTAQLVSAILEQLGVLSWVEGQI
ncbi:hypothetical protein JCM33374_g2429 [Metschnikowia sp. JCM 33374]|nr:hypothetical protein JCM33374_g2429 [Metschnikowia sp. JCM 33374]